MAGLPRQPLGDGLTLVEASTRRARRRGLAGLTDLPPQLALHIPRCWSVHTVGMRFGLDLVWLDRGGEVVRVDGGVGPRRLKACLRARSVVEINAGQADRFLAAGLSPGDDSPGTSPTCLDRRRRFPER